LGCVKNIPIPKYDSNIKLKKKGIFNMANFLMCDIPEDMKTYLSYYGMNFSKKLYEFAVSNMRRESADGKMEKVKPMTADELKSLLSKHNIEIEHNDLYNALYLAAMVKADYWGSSIEDEEHLAKYIEDTLCDVDASEGQVFARYLADCSVGGCIVHWESMI
jgi:hypothetical protein